MMTLTIKQCIHYLYKNRIKIIIALVILYNLIYYISPKVEVSFHIKDVSSEDFMSFIKNNKINNQNLEPADCKIVNIDIKASKPLLLIHHLKINVSPLSQYMKQMPNFNHSTDNILYLLKTGKVSSTAYSESMYLYMNDVNEEKVKELFKDYKAEITWTNLLSGKGSQSIYLKDVYE